MRLQLSQLFACLGFGESPFLRDYLFQLRRLMSIRFGRVHAREYLVLDLPRAALCKLGKSKYPKVLSAPEKVREIGNFSLLVGSIRVPFGNQLPMELVELD